MRTTPMTRIPVVDGARGCGTAHVARATRLDFSGVYRPINAAGPGEAADEAHAPAVLPRQHPVSRCRRPRGPRRSPTARRGRSPTAPQLTPEYLAKWQAMSKAHRGIVGERQHREVPAARHAGDDEHGLRHGGDADEGQDHVLQRAQRRAAPRVSRRPQADAGDPRRPDLRGLFHRHWEGDTLVVETVALRDNTYIEGFTPHSDQMTVRERIRFVAPGICSRIGSRSPIRRRW